MRVLMLKSMAEFNLKSLVVWQKGCFKGMEKLIVDSAKIS